MITLDNITLEFSSIGLFDCDGEWIHPTVTVPTYELIFVTSGEVHIRDSANFFSLKKGDMLLLDKLVEHGGTKKSFSHTSFYWLHFYSNDINKLVPEKKSFVDYHLTERALKEIMHLSYRSKPLAELTLFKFLLERSFPQENKNRYAYEIAEFIRINRDKSLTVTELSKRFGYTADHLSRLIKKEFGIDAKTFIIKKRLEFIESLLINTDYSSKEIAQAAGFDSENHFLKFLKYHSKLTPSAFRNKFFYLHMNNK